MTCGMQIGATLHFSKLRLDTHFALADDASEFVLLLQLSLLMFCNLFLFTRGFPEEGEYM